MESGKQNPTSNEGNVNETTEVELNESNANETTDESFESSHVSDEISCTEISSENSCSTNLCVITLDKETEKKLRGDAIGETLYSESFVLKSLLQFSDLKWNEQMEEDLCFLWDMTSDKEVCLYLLKMCFPSIACSALRTSSENRFNEIVIGMLANILSVCPEKHFLDEEVYIILKQLDSDDPLILIQVIRFIMAYAYQAKELPLITEEIMEKIKFILINSLNNELLLNTLNMLSKITFDFKLEYKLVNVELYNITLDTYHNLMFENTSEFSLDTNDKVSLCRYMLEIIFNIVQYVRFDRQLLLDLQENAEKYVKEAIIIVNYFKQEENLFPITSKFEFCVTLFQSVLETLNVNYYSSLLISFCEIILMTIDLKKEFSEMFDSIVDLVIFFLSKGDFQTIKNDLGYFPPRKLKTLLKIVHEYHGPTGTLDMSKLLSLVH